MIAVQFGSGLESQRSKTANDAFRPCGLVEASSDSVAVIDRFAFNRLRPFTRELPPKLGQQRFGQKRRARKDFESTKPSVLNAEPDVSALEDISEMADDRRR